MGTCLHRERREPAGGQRDVLWNGDQRAEAGLHDLPECGAAAAAPTAHLPQRGVHLPDRIQDPALLLVHEARQQEVQLLLLHPGEVEQVRIKAKCAKVFPDFIIGEDLFGLNEPTIVKVLESLPGVESLQDYTFKYGRNPMLELPLAVNPTGCARSEPKLRTHVKRIHNFQRTPGPKKDLDRSAKEMVPFLVGLETIGPYSKNFVQSKSSQYRKMKQEWRQNVVLARSKIQGLGLYAGRDLEKGRMIIEYIGEVIRSNLTDLREKHYEDQNRGIYMFRLDDERVVA